MTAMRALLLMAFVTTVGALTLPSVAEAKLVIVNIGDEIFDAGPLPEPWDGRAEYAGWRAGYKCGVFGVFWTYFHAWECKPVAYQGDTYDDSPEVVEAISATYSESDKQMGLWGKHGRWLLAGLVVIGAMVGAGDDE